MKANNPIIVLLSFLNDPKLDEYLKTLEDIAKLVPIPGSRLIAKILKLLIKAKPLTSLAQKMVDRLVEK